MPLKRTHPPWALRQVYCIRHLRHGNKYACKTLGKKKLLSQLDAEDIKKEIEVGVCRAVCGRVFDARTHTNT